MQCCDGSVSGCSAGNGVSVMVVLVAVVLVKVVLVTVVLVEKKSKSFTCFNVFEES